MPVAPAITKLDDLLERPAVAALLAWRREAVQSAQFDRNELTIYVERSAIREACTILKTSAEVQFNFLSDLTCVDLYPSEPRFELVYHLLSMKRKERVRLKVQLPGSDASLESITSVWPAANFFEREIFDLFGVRFQGHPYLRRLLMPEDWEGHPLRKDYPVEGYR
ncbi:MAG TPA: NADH-quinone oxidoreductase subunit C [Terriglobales bacterium]|nr:NADH-quinone oxidoreductase subunit C [Terriglobales bacterium]